VHCSEKKGAAQRDAARRSTPRRAFFVIDARASAPSAPPANHASAHTKVCIAAKKRVRRSAMQRAQHTTAGAPAFCDDARVWRRQRRHPPITHAAHTHKVCISARKEKEKRDAERAQHTTTRIL
jgi:hypothetical protein